MLKNLLYTAFRTLCPKIFTKSTNKIQQEISSSQTSGTYVAPNNGVREKEILYCGSCQIIQETIRICTSFTVILKHRNLNATEVCHA